jgi:hypothetical protein
VPDFLMGDDPKAVKSGLVDAFRDLLGLRFGSLLFAHGDPLVGEGKRAMQEFVEAYAGSNERLRGAGPGMDPLG